MTGAPVGSRRPEKSTVWSNPFQGALVLVLNFDIRKIGPRKCSVEATGVRRKRK